MSDISEKNLVTVYDLDEPTLRRVVEIAGGLGCRPGDPVEKLIQRLKAIYFQGFKVLISEDGGDPKIVPGKIEQKHKDALNGTGRKTRQRTRSKKQHGGHNVAGPSTSKGASGSSHASQGHSQAARTINTIPPPPASQPNPRGGNRKSAYKQQRDELKRRLLPPPETNITEKQLADAYDHVLEIEQILSTINVQKEEHRTLLLDEVEKMVDALEEDVNEYVKVRLDLEKTIMGWKDGLVRMDTESAKAPIPD